MKILIALWIGLFLILVGISCITKPCLNTRPCSLLEMKLITDTLDMCSDAILGLQKCKIDLCKEKSKNRIGGQND